MLITHDVLEEFKDRMHMDGSAEDDNLIRILSASVTALKEDCGEYDLSHERFKELVFDRSRYVYNDRLEEFDENFQRILTTLGVNKALADIDLGEDSL